MLPGTSDTGYLIKVIFPGGLLETIICTRLKVAPLFVHPLTETLNMKKLFSILTLMAAFLAFSPAFAQTSGAVQAQSPLTRDLGAIQTLTNQVAGTVNSADQSGFNASRVTCVFNMASRVGTPSATFKIQNKDAASGLYYDLIESSSISNLATPTPVSAGSGITTTANLATNRPLARTWRTSVTVSGSTSLTGTVGCTVQ